MPAQNRRPLHPLLAAAAVAIILVCLIALATMTGILPSTQGALVTAHAATPIDMPANTIKHLPALSAADSLGPGEALIDIDAKSVMAKLRKEAPAKRTPPAASSSSSSATSVQKPDPVAIQTAVTASRANQAPSPRIVPVYRDLRNIDAGKIDEEDGIRELTDEQQSDAFQERFELPSSVR